MNKSIAVGQKTGPTLYYGAPGQNLANSGTRKCLEIPAIEPSAAGMDMCPALSQDGKTFCWFASRANESLGSSDIYWTYQSNIDRVLESAK